jgi:predicted XRE-type DNA-binding protein
MRVDNVLNLRHSVSEKPVRFHPKALDFIREQSVEIRKSLGEAIRDLQKGKMAKRSKAIITRTTEELGAALGLSSADAAEMEFRSELTVALMKIIESGKMTHLQIAQAAGTSRTRVTAIANGNTQGVSTDVLIRVLAATGYRAELRFKKAA